MERGSKKCDQGNIRLQRRNKNIHGGRKQYRKAGQKPPRVVGPTEEEEEEEKEEEQEQEEQEEERRKQ